MARTEKGHPVTGEKEHMQDLEIGQLALAVNLGIALGRLHTVGVVNIRIGEEIHTLRAVDLDGEAHVKITDMLRLLQAEEVG